MKLCVYGSGAIGSYLATKLIRAGHHQVSLVARGGHLAAIRDRGLRLVYGQDETTVVPAAATDVPQELPVQDIVFVTLKAHGLSNAAPDIARLLGREGYAVFINNGVPWWWYGNVSGTGRPMKRTDPDGKLWQLIGPRRAIGCVVNSSNEILEPGVVLHKGLNRWILGEPDDTISERLLSLVTLLNQAGVHAESSDDIRQHVWRKLLRNVSLNSISALTRLNIAQIGRSAALTELAQAMMAEVVRTAGALGYDLTEMHAQEQRFLGATEASPGPVAAGARPSMLQDALNQRPMEVDAILGEVQEFARANRVPTPTLDVVLTLLEGLDCSIACQREAIDAATPVRPAHAGIGT